MRKAIVLLALAATLSGCGGGAKSRLREQEAFLKGQQQAIAARQQAQEPAVWFRGLIRNPRVPWAENLTLAQALLAAEYTGTLDPTNIRVIRQGRTYPVDPKALVRGLDNPLLEPGDIVEVTR